MTYAARRFGYARCRFGLAYPVRYSFHWLNKMRRAWAKMAEDERRQAGWRMAARIETEHGSTY